MNPDARRLALEAELLPGELEAVHAMMATLGRPLRTWPRISWLRIFVEVAAVEALTGRLQGDGGRDPALRRACSELGVLSDTHERRLYRAQADAFDPEKDPGRK